VAFEFPAKKATNCVTHDDTSSVTVVTVLSIELCFICHCVKRDAYACKSNNHRIVLVAGFAKFQRKKAPTHTHTHTHKRNQFWTCLLPRLIVRNSILIIIESVCVQSCRLHFLRSIYVAETLLERMKLSVKLLSGCAKFINKYK